MELRPLGRTGLLVSAIALGTMTFGREADEVTSAAIYSTARDAGVILMDTADAYADGASETILGRLMAGHRQELLVATKAGTPIPGAGVNARGAHPVHLQQQLATSLARLQTDYVDLYYIHYFDPTCPLERTLACLDGMVRAGQIRYPALSNFAAWQVTKALGISALHGWAAPAAIQPMYNLVKRQAEVELLPMAASEGLGVCVYSPLAAGILSGKYQSRNQAAGQARMNSDAKYQGRYSQDRHYDVGQAFSSLAAEVGEHPVTLANRWVLGHGAVSCALAGARSVEQLQPALAAGATPISSELWQRCADLVPEPAIATDRDEERAGSTGSGVSPDGFSRPGII
jgi:aryl-alcohol dehydrogenase-like predicted oxidoreductase